MIENDIVNKILSIEDTESGGDNALDGFEFQVSSAIYLIFDELESKREFQLAYEKLEDFIIFSNKVNLYQAKSISKNLTPTILYTAKKSTKKDSSTLSIIEKMNNNYTSIKNVISDVEVTSTLIICKDQCFSEKLSSLPNIKVEESLSFKDFKDEKIIPTGLLPGRNVFKAMSEASKIESKYDDSYIQEKGYRREAIVFPKNISCKYDASKKVCSLDFVLQKGSYATVFVEFLANRNFS